MHIVEEGDLFYDFVLVIARIGVVACFLFWDLVEFDFRIRLNLFASQLTNPELFICFFVHFD